MFTGKIKKNQEFSSIFKSGKYLKLDSLVIQYKEKSACEDKYSARYGIVVNKKVGNAVKRNFSKRRLKAILNNINDIYNRKSMDYIFVAKKKISKKKFSDLQLELNAALKKLTGQKNE